MQSVKDYIIFESLASMVYWSRDKRVLAQLNQDRKMAREHIGGHYPYIPFQINKTGPEYGGQG